MNILDVKVSTYFNLSDIEVQDMKLRTLSTSDIKNAEDLKQRMLEYIHLNSLEMTPVTLATLNRRFIKVAHRCDTDVMGAARDLNQLGKLAIFEDRQAVFISKAVLDEQAAALSGTALSAARERMLSQAK